MLAATLKRYRDKDYLRGKDEGRVEGRVEGEWATLQKTLMQLLLFRFTPNQTDQKSFAQQLAQIENIAHLQNLLNVLLRRESSLVEFTTHLNNYLPPDPKKA